MRPGFALFAAGIVTLGVAAEPSAPPPRLVILTETGVTRDGLPVLTRHAAPEPYERALGRGFSGRLLKLYRWHQEARFRREGTAIEPAYLLLSGTQGGFPRFGFFLDAEPKPDVAYVDLHRNGRISGRFGAIDQLFPHELLHVIVRQCTGPPVAGGANQVHAVAVRTDPVVAWNEGFAEHAQVMAIDDADALPETRALAGDAEGRRRAARAFEAYRRAVSARLALAPRATAAFPLWFSSAEQALRYHGVKENRFAYEAPMPGRLLAGPDPYAAYLIENVVPGDPGGVRKGTARALSTEGVVSTLFARWMSDPALRERGPAGLYAECGIDVADAEPADRAYLKLFRVLRDARPRDTAGVLRAYREAFPAEAPAIDRVVASVLGTTRLPEAREIWLANPDFSTGTSLFDQARALPRPHTFDLNAASVTDLVSVPGIDAPLARTLIEAGPYDAVGDLSRVPGVTAPLAERLRGMEHEMVRLRTEAVEEETVLRLQDVLLPYLWRALAVWLAAAALGTVAYRLVRRVAWWRAALYGLGGSLAALGAGWIAGGWTPLAPFVLFGVPGSAFAALARRGRVAGWRVALAWVAALAPAWIALA